MRNETIFLEGIKPINDFFFFSCFNAALFPALEYLGTNFYPVMASIIPFYMSSTEKYENIRFEYQILEDILQLQDMLGIEICQFDHLENKAQFQQYMKAQIPMIVTVDCYYLSHRSDHYQKDHYRHALLLAGYNSQSDQVMIIDQLSEDIKSDILWIPIDELIHSNHKYISKWENRDPSTFITINKKNDNINYKEKLSSEFVRNLYLSNQKRSQKQYQEGFLELIEFKDHFSLHLNESFIDKIYPNWLYGLNDLVKTTKAELSLYQFIFGDGSEEFKTKMNIHSLWKKIRIRVLKYEFSKKFNYYYLQEISSMIDQIYQNEIRLQKLFHIT